jgi:hypothetical protein
MKYYVYSTKYDRGDRRMARWVEFDNLITAKLFAKVNGYKLLAKGK